MSRLMTVLMLGAFVLIEPCSAQVEQATPASPVQSTPVQSTPAQPTPAPAAQAAATANAPNATRASHNSSHSKRSDRHNYWHSNDDYSPAVGYSPYSVPYSYGYTGYGRYYPYGGVYSNYGYPINLNRGLERGFRYGNTYINPNFGN